MNLTALLLLLPLLLPFTSAKRKGNKPALIKIVMLKNYRLHADDMYSWTEAECKSIGGWQLSGGNWDYVGGDPNRIASSTWVCECAHGNLHENRNIKIYDIHGAEIARGELTFGFKEKLGCQRTGAN